MKKTLLVILLLFALAVPALALQTPDQFLGFKLGSDRNLAHYNQIKAYFELLAKGSPRVRTVTLGKTTLGNDLFMAVLSDEANLNDMEKLKAISRQLSQGEVDAAEAGAPGRRRQGHRRRHLQPALDRDRLLADGHGAWLPPGQLAAPRSRISCATSSWCCFPRSTPTARSWKWNGTTRPGARSTKARARLTCITGTPATTTTATGSRPA